MNKIKSFKAGKSRHGELKHLPLPLSLASYSKTTQICQSSILFPTPLKTVNTTLTFGSRSSSTRPTTFWLTVVGGLTTQHLRMLESKPGLTSHFSKQAIRPMNGRQKPHSTREESTMGHLKMKSTPSSSPGSVSTKAKSTYESSTRNSRQPKTSWKTTRASSTKSP